MQEAELMNEPKNVKEAPYLTETLQVHKGLRKLNENDVCK